ncbi:hypothetical protein CMESO_331 (nucleomorph) [Chroomonas mesostigmatica CCMP1168]|uniref:Cytochrome b561 domain-containing protein n=1 Tax=Chroomonas mesostigmatica CCMP1168 TaxID=1195612 RepID=J7G886_9CRYP|nr:hypothetical protein CMESO_331 [Chroomonas mesostigmatica CCMP1168]|mmetsp:Transcript_25138/g.61790  ORF Transcript_25138/g.61790 Transcript_25138/m.61790 type:complete len:179 (-) Transcript_25138:781-1317(-)
MWFFYCFFLQKINYQLCLLYISKKKFKFTRFLIYSIFVFNAYQLKFYLSNNIRFTVMNRIWCPAFGTTERCDIAIRVSFVGILFGIFMLSTVFFSLLDKKERLKKIYRFEIQFIILQFILWLALAFVIFRWNREIGAKGNDIFKIYLHILKAILLLSIGMWIVSHEEKLKIKKKIDFH